MASTRLFMDFDIVAQGSARFNSDMQHMQAKLNKLEASLRELEGRNWDGASKAAYDDAYRRWHLAANDLVKLGMEFSGTIKHCNGLMQQCEADNVASIGKASRYS
ncbi:WXG100 family type VII secretion target [Dactylosporangium roseum]|uniref:ESAT-6-like protein n=1 Tax=Dactylosporangium roseum TaxID=47989 RepID=A0ABY5YZ17_9ACTN|nr:WXG100 family type VII secretion target [Dactylosporangium roseum]UWZ34621.1 WXG100 family type VII secretion target [Dactylosporangium roseum]